MQLIPGWSVWERERDSNHWGALRVYMLQDAFIGKRIGPPPVSDSEASRSDYMDECVEGEEVGEDGVDVALANDQVMGVGELSSSTSDPLPYLGPYKQAHSVPDSHSSQSSHPSWITTTEESRCSTRMSTISDGKGHEHQRHHHHPPVSNSTPSHAAPDELIIADAVNEDDDQFWQLQPNPDAKQVLSHEQQEDESGHHRSTGKDLSSSSGNTTSNSWSMQETISCAFSFI